MSDRLAWFMLALGPPALVALLGLRAVRRRRPGQWDDYRDAVTLLEMVAAPMLVVGAPFLMTDTRLSELAAGMLSAAAILLFYVTMHGFSTEAGGTLSRRLKGILAWSTRGAAMAAYLAIKGMEGEVSHIYPSAQLFVVLFWAWYASYYIIWAMVRSDYRARELGASDLLSRVHEIAEHRGVRLDHVTVIARIPGYNRWVNAVALSGTQIALAQDLVTSLSKTEVDAVIEHEIGHVSDERIWSLDRALSYGSYLLLVALVYLAERYVPAMQWRWSPPRYVMWLALFLVPGMLERWYSRKRERRANENVGVITEPRSAISGLYKVSVLNRHSISRPWWSRIMSTHPYVDEEINEIATRAGLSAEQVQQVFRTADAEIAGGVDHYDLPSTEDAIPKSGDSRPVTAPVSRPGRWAGWHVVVLGLLGAALVMAGAIWATCAARGFPGLAILMVGLAASVASLAIPITLYNRRQVRLLCEKVQARLAEQYGEDAVTCGLLVDVLLPDWTDRDHPWQGALISASHGELVILGEVSRFTRPLDPKLSVFRWADGGSSGEQARMVAIGYQDAGNPQAIHVRMLGRPGRRDPRNWKQLEKHIKEMLIQAGANLVPRKELEPPRRGKFRWSARVPIAAGVFALILALGGFLAIEIVGAGWFGVGMFCFIATSVAGRSLWAWVTGEYRPDDREH